MHRHLLLLTALLAPAIAHADPAQARESRKPGTFHGLELGGTIAVEARIAPATSVEVVGDADLVAEVTTEVKHGVLEIRTKHDKHRGKVRVIVSSPELASLGISGTGSLAVTGLANDRLDVDIAGHGDLVVAGTTGDLHVAIAGTGSVQAKNLVASSIALAVPGTASAVLHATKTVDVTVSGTASVEVFGRPRVSQHGSGVVALSEH